MKHDERVPGAQWVAPGHLSALAAEMDPAFAPAWQLERCLWFHGHL